MSDVYELNTSRKYLNNEGKPRAEREFVVVDAASEAAVVALFGSTLPDEYENYPNDSGLPYDMLAFDFSITKEPNALNTWRVIMRYRAEIAAATAPTNPTSTEKTPNQVGYRTARLSMSAEFKDQFRKFSSVEAMQAKCTSAYEATDIGGTSNDVNGHMLSVLSRKQNITILITDQYLPDARQIELQIGTRNDRKFLNYPTNSVVFIGCNSEIIPEVGRNSIEYNFVFDQALHYIQYPVRGVEGSIILAKVATGSIAKGSALQVFHKQPFPYSTNFDQLSQYFTGL